MRVCFIATEIFAYEVYGGFGALTRMIARGLSERGINVYVVMPRYPQQKPVEIMDGFIILSIPSEKLSSYKYRYIYRLIDADIYHSEEPSLGTYIAQKVTPEKMHIVTFQDPRTIEDRKVEWEYLNLTKTERLKLDLTTRIFYYLTKKAVKRADALYCQARYAIPKVMKVYELKNPPEFLPNPVEIPERDIKKSDEPVVCFLARWDPRKRPEYFFELAKIFPDVKFIAMGKAQPHFAKRDKMLREEYGKIPNLIMTGFVSEKEKSKILERSWILINTSWRECLPVSYLEACAHKCAILSHENPDDFAKNFGYHARIGDLKDFEKGLKWLLEDDRWKDLGEKGYEYIKEVHEFNKVIDKHIEIYRKLLE
jgi:glycosyltransferase involved in cell wall biosynthesis